MLYIPLFLPLLRILFIYEISNPVLSVLNYEQGLFETIACLLNFHLRGSIEYRFQIELRIICTVEIRFHGVKERIESSKLSKQNNI